MTRAGESADSDVNQDGFSSECNFHPNRATRMLGWSLLSLFVLFWCGIIGVVYYAVRVNGQVVKQAYMCDWTADFLIGHLQTTDNRWPTGWDDLRDEFEASQNRGYAFTFNELQTEVTVDWQATIQEVAEAHPPSQLIRLTTGKTAGFAGDDPNDRVRSYCQSVQSR